ncbi:MAG TPA: hypothetical protein PKA41_16235 [Verrucomicrobiota bacterium]|nr:hypothetical protein [Verrucomicrobiota bacterium]
MAFPVQFAVLLRELNTASAEQLKRAFSGFSNLTEADAVRMAVSARGVLQRRMNRDAARAFHQALEAEGVVAVIVPEEELPQLPDARVLHRVQLTPEAFVVYDLAGRATPVEWRRIRLVAAANVARFEFGRTRTERTQLRFNPMTGVWPKRVEDTGHRTDWDVSPLLEVLLADNAGRYQIEATEFPFKYVLDRPDLSVNARFAWLVRELVAHAPDALLNSGAAALAGGQESLPRYESRQLLAEDMVWLLWKQPVK